MERFVQSVVAGGLALVAGLWLAEWFTLGSFPWLLGAGMALLGTGGLAVGIWSELEHSGRERR